MTISIVYEDQGNGTNGYNIGGELIVNTDFIVKELN